MTYFRQKENQSYEKYLVESLKELKVLPKSVKKFPQEFDEDHDYYIVNHQQITLREGDNDYKEFRVNPVPEDFSIRYGCELETCFVLNCSMKKVEKDIREIFVEKNQTGKVFWRDWEKLILYHIRVNLVPTFTKKFLEKFRYAYIMGYHQEEAIFVDLKTGLQIFDSKKVDTYKTLQFAQDASVKCGDSDPDNESLTVHCEIISPILEDITDIKLIYENLISQICNESNESSGFHVNVSAADSKGKEIELTPGLLFEICHQWYPYEKKNYPDLRGDNNHYAVNMSLLVDNLDLVNYFYKRHDGKRITKEELFVPEKSYGLRNLIYMDEIEGKYHSLHLKPNSNILEFRVFPSSSDMSILLKYVKDALKIIEKAFTNFIKDPEKIAKEYFRVRTPYYRDKYFKSFFYKGSYQIYKQLMKYDAEFPNFEEYLKDFDTEIIIEKEVTESYFLFFTQKKTIQQKITQKGLQEGFHKYNKKISLNNRGKYREESMQVEYKPQEDYIRVFNYDNVTYQEI